MSKNKPEAMNHTPFRRHVLAYLANNSLTGNELALKADISETAIATLLMDGAYDFHITDLFKLSLAIDKVPVFEFGEDKKEEE